MALQGKQRSFVEHYLATWNATEAAKRAGYSEKSAYSIGSENLRKPEVAAAIAARVAELKMGADEVLLRLKDQARASLGDFLRIERVTYHPRQPVPDPTSDDPKAVRWVEDPELVERLVVEIDLEGPKAANKLHLLKKYKVGQWGPEIELHDPQAALQLLGKHHGLFVERHEHAGVGGGPVKFVTVIAEPLPERYADDLEA